MKKYFLLLFLFFKPCYGSVQSRECEGQLADILQLLKGYEDLTYRPRYRSNDFSNRINRYYQNKLDNILFLIKTYFTDREVAQQVLNRIKLREQQGYYNGDPENRKLAKLLQEVIQIYLDYPRSYPTELLEKFESDELVQQMNNTLIGGLIYLAEFVGIYYAISYLLE